MATYDNQSLARGFKILECLTMTDDALPVSEVARRTGLHRATTHRILTVLLQMGYVHKNANDASYSTSFYLHSFGHPNHTVAAIRRHAAPFMRRLSTGLKGERVVLGCLEGPQVAICHVVASDTLRWETQCEVGVRLDAHASAIGKSLLALRPEDEIRARYRSFLMSTHGPRTLRQVGSLVAELSEVRRNGFATDDCESGPDTLGVAAPIMNPAGRAMCAIGIEGPRSRLPADFLRRYAPLVTDTARKIAAYILNSDAPSPKRPPASRRPASRPVETARNSGSRH